MRCAARGVPTSRLLTVRQPHDYWASLFRYAWACITHEIDPTSCNSAESKALLADPASGVAHNATHSSRGVLGSFGAFMRYVRDSPLWANKSQAARIRRGCGVPCRYNELLRTERLASDWASLLQRHPGLPRVALPPVNVNTAAMEAARSHPWGRVRHVAVSDSAIRHHALTTGCCRAGAICGVDAAALLRGDGVGRVGLRRLWLLRALPHWQRCRCRCRSRCRRRRRRIKHRRCRCRCHRPRSDGRE